MNWGAQSAKGIRSVTASNSVQQKIGAFGMDDEKKGRVGEGGRVASQERPWQAGNRFW